MPRTANRRRAVSLAETAIAVVIVGLLLVTALNTLGVSKTMQQVSSDRSQGMQLAQDLMSEILEQAYEDPAESSGSFGLKTAEASKGDRSLFDDVDDYHNWSSSPPQQRDGTEISGLSGWKRAVTVQRVRADNPGQTYGSDSGIKRIVVQASCHGVVAAELTALRSRSWSDAEAVSSGGSSQAAGEDNNAPKAVIQASRNNGTAPMIVNLSGSLSSDPDAGDTLTYNWDFGDGGVAAGATVQHTFTGAGLYLVSLVVTDNHGASDVASVDISVLGK